MNWSDQGSQNANTKAPTKLYPLKSAHILHSTHTVRSPEPRVQRNPASDGMTGQSILARSEAYHRAKRSPADHGLHEVVQYPSGVVHKVPTCINMKTEMYSYDPTLRLPLLRCKNSLRP